MLDWRQRLFAVALRACVPLGLLAVAAVLHSETKYREALAAPPLAVSTWPAAVAELPSVGSHRPFSEHAIRAGETLSQVFGDLGLSRRDAQAATDALRRHLDPRRVRAGDPYRAYFGQDRQLSGVEFAVAGKGEVRLTRATDRWETSWRSYAREVVVRTLAGEVTGALESAIRAAGGATGLAASMADVLQWDLDFNRDLRVGDRFEVLYEEVRLDGKPSGLGDIVALSFQAGSRRLEAYRYAGGYYDAEGRPLRKMFLKSPLPYSRVTSGFSNRRFHPVLKVYRPHLGVDLGAPAGTPVRVTAAGTVVAAGWDGGGGKTVKVRHPGGYITAYLHLSRFASGIQGGARVAQGDTIGFVGSTGLATAAHLDYRVQRNGKWMNPMSLGGVAAEPIAKADLATFSAWRDALRVSLATGAPLPVERGTRSTATQLAALPPTSASRESAARR
jgi:murein DD-endopeptidase MepM/ murein hydrolase activator NlpD